MEKMTYKLFCVTNLPSARQPFSANVQKKKEMQLGQNLKGMFFQRNFSKIESESSQMPPPRSPPPPLDQSGLEEP